jgi:regulator of sigma E protease
LVTEVVPESPAASAGLEVGDQIMQFDDVPPTDTVAFRKAVLASEPEIEVTILRNRQKHVVPVRLDGPPVRVGLSWRTDDAEPGVMIVQRVVDGSPVDEAGLQTGDRILEINGQAFSNETEFRSDFRSAGNSPDLTIERQGRQWQATLHLPQSQTP